MGQHKNRKQYKFLSVNGKLVRAHRHVMEQHLGRKLASNEHIHHIDGDGMNNDIANLQVMTPAEHNVHSGRECRPAAILLESDIPVIRKMLADGIQQWLIGRAYGVGKWVIQAINVRRTWSWA